MIRLLEHEGKALLARNGMRVPRGALYPELPPHLHGALVVKAQVLAGGRAKAGGIKYAGNETQAHDIARTLMGASIAGAVVQAVYVEERLDIEHEYYLCAMVDRDLGAPVILASREGGVEIEGVAADAILRRPVDPLIGLRPYVVEEIVRFLDPPDRARIGVRAAVSSLYGALVQEDAELIEVNPLAVLEDGSVVAADAKCVLDEDATYRHGARPQDFDGTPFEIAARKLGTIGIEMQGNIAAIMNGAGMTMATLDEIISLGGTLRALVELHGAPMHGPERVAEIVKLVCTLEPRVLLINVYYQLRSIEIIARGLILARDRGWLAAGCKVVVRFRGEKESESRTMLADVDCTLTSAFDEACALAVKYASKPAPAAIPT